MRRLVLGAVCVAVAVVAVGRWERHRYVSTEQAHLRALLAAVGGRFDSRLLTGYRPLDPTCFWYEAGGNRFGISLCFDHRGRLIEASDRRGATPVYWSLQPMPAAASVHVDPRLVARLIARMEVVAPYG